MILGVECDEQEINKLTDVISAEITSAVKRYKLPFEITVSVGTATGSCLNENEFRELMNRADQAMYEKKMEKKILYNK